MRCVFFSLFAAVFAAIPAVAGAQTPPPNAPKVEPADDQVRETPTFVVGKWATTIYGFGEFDSIFDSTEGLSEVEGNTPIPRPGTYAGDHGRTTFSVRNSRIGLRENAPAIGAVRVSGQLEMDFLGTQLPMGNGQPYDGSEQANFVNATLRIRHANVRVETPVVDFLFGQYWALFGWQNLYHPNSVEVQGLPGELYERTPQVRISKTVRGDALTFEAAIAALRPVQRDSMIPDGQAGVRLALNAWTGLTTGGATGTSIQPMSIAVTGAARAVRLPAFQANTDNSNTRAAGALAVDAFVPIVPAMANRKSNALSVTAEFATGYGMADHYSNTNFGVSFPSLPNPMNATPAPAPTPNFPDVDPNIVTYDANGVLHYIESTSFIVGAQYALPGLDGRMWISGNFSRVNSDNAKLYASPAKAFLASDWFDVNLFVDVTSALRFGIEYANTNDEYADGTHAINHRLQFSSFFMF